MQKLSFYLKISLYLKKKKKDIFISKEEKSRNSWRYTHIWIFYASLSWIGFFLISYKTKRWWTKSLTEEYPFKYLLHKMVKHLQKIHQRKSNELFESVWLFCGFGVPKDLCSLNDPLLWKLFVNMVLITYF